MTQPPPLESVAVEPEKLRGTMAEGFARVDGSLALLIPRGDQTDRRLADHELRLDIPRTRPMAPSLRRRAGRRSRPPPVHLAVLRPGAYA
ncbi:hypothetical protein ABT384_38250 [Streptomyces lanatus]|uniref:Uncharacterized protein n=1 Tax=Streptomyces lanatus TaxID=66900 RepID=A0ABV1Y412_9ACTN